MSLNYTEAKELPSWMTAKPEPKYYAPDMFEELNDHEVMLQLESAVKPKRPKGGCSKTGEIFHLQQDYWKGNIIIGRWARDGKATAREPRPSFTHPADVKFGRDVVAPIATVAYAEEGREVITALIVESCEEWYGKLDFLCLFKIPEALKEHLVDSGKVKEHKILTLDGISYLRSDFQLPLRTVPDWFCEAVDTVGDVCVKIQVQSVLNEVPMAYAGWCSQWFDLAIISEERVLATPELSSYLVAMAMKRAKAAYILGKMLEKKDLAKEYGF